MKSLALLVLLVLLALPAAALEPYLVQDINPVPQPDGSKPSDLVRLGGAVLFFAEGGTQGRGLWRSDGTTAGTWLLSELCESDGCGTPGSFLVTERLYFFLMPDESARDALWVSDGTPAGTFRLTGPGVSTTFIPQRLWAARQGVLYFAAGDPEHGPELWRSDGTPAGTYLVADIRPGAQGSGVQWLTEYRGRVWFGAGDGQSGGALWSTDGTQAGTVLELDPLPSAASHPAPEYLRVFGNRLTFFALAPGGGQQLWIGDGTATRTAPLTALRGKRGSVLRDSAVRENRLYFVAEDKRGQELWVSDGTAGGTRRLTAFPRRDAFFSYVGEFELNLPSHAPLKDRFVFRALDGPHGVELWVTDGTPNGTRLLRDVCPGACSGVRDLWPELNGRLYFTAEEPSHGYELWSTDGTEAGTRLALDLCPGCSGFPFAPFVLAGRILFVAQDGQTGYELWSTGGTAAGTVRLSDYEPHFVWDRFDGAILNGQLLFNARENLYGEELWRSDGTAAGTQLVRDIKVSDIGGSFVTGLHAFGDSAVFLADDGVHGYELWRSHGPGPGASLIGDLTPGEEPVYTAGLEGEAAGGNFFFLSSGLWRTDGTEAGTLQLLGLEAEPCCLRAVGGSVFFLADDGNDANGGGEGLWTSDGTAAGTRMLGSIPSASPNATSRDLIAFQGKLYFIANSPADLRVSDGTEAGTVQVKSFGDGAAPVSSLLTVHAGRLWFFSGDDEHGYELWSSDGTEAGTAMAVDLVPGSGSFEAHFMVSIGTSLIVSGFADEGGLWATDGTPEGTRKVGAKLASRSYRSPHAVFQGRLFFATDDEELWVSDGTEAGTVRFHTYDGKAIAYPEAFAVLADCLLFVAEGTLYQSDGTEAGTFPIRDRVMPELVRAGDRVFFGGFDAATGWELWAVRP